LSWFLARVKKHLPQAIEALDAYYPVIERITKPKRKKKPVISQYPILPKTLIVDENLYDQAMLMPNIRGSVKFNKKLLILDDADIQRFREIEEENRIREVDELVITFNPGDEVTILTGCFIGKIAVVEDQVDKYSYRVSLNGANFPIIINGCLLNKSGLYTPAKE
jgi:transcription antitermination factor NusG